MKLIDIFRDSITDIIYPQYCRICGTRNQPDICKACAEKRFESANPEFKSTCTDIILPEGVAFQHALWNFDKGGHLQDLLHGLKYSFAYKIGHILGYHLGQSMKSHPRLIDWKKAILIPVPLHKDKLNKRGYNQARIISEGIIQTFDSELPLINPVMRVRFTESQTGFSLSERAENMKKVFSVRNSSQLKYKTLIIVDDVFTTGATSFELARTLTEVGVEKIGIVTVAQA